MTRKTRIVAGVIAIIALRSIVPLSASAQATKPIVRMGSSNVQSFDKDWQFMRYGLQPDGSRIDEPKDLESISYPDAKWQRLDLPHDWAITGPFRIDLAGETGKLPWKGIGWYRKHFIVPSEDAGKKVFIDFDGAMANAE